MSGRSLAYLTETDLDKISLLGGKRSAKMREAGIRHVADLLLHAPRRYVDRSRIVPLSEVPVGEEVTVIGKVTDVKVRRIRNRMVIVDAAIYDGSSYLFAVWFNQPFRERQLKAAGEVALSGKVERYRGKRQMSSPAVDVLDKPGESLITGRVVPIHPTVGGVQPGVLRRAIHNALKRSRPISDPLPDELLDRLDLMGRDAAIAAVHFPETLEEAEAARNRLVFDELFRIEVALALRKRRQIDEQKGIPHEVDGELLDHFVGSLPFRLTTGQERVVGEILTDLARPHPMHRLLIGEVGSGKTVVAMAALLAGIQGGYQGAFMAPTEILAQQHYFKLNALVERAGMQPEIEHDDDELGMESLFTAPAPPPPDAPPLRLALLTAGSAEANFRLPGATRRDDLLASIAAGDVDLVVGTHSLIQEGVAFRSLGVAVVDEQHRFGVHQRVSLRDKGDDAAQPDLLIMTATPIPRTLSMTLYGDLDVSAIRGDEMPPPPPDAPDARTITTRHLTWAPGDMQQVYERIHEEARTGRQTFVVCPLVEDSDKIEVQSAISEQRRLEEELGTIEFAVEDPGIPGWSPSQRQIGLIHGQMSTDDKARIMREFSERRFPVLVATTVIEVGIDIVHSTVMVIEDADRFGLNQLHQLRGRLSRGVGPNYCFLIAEPTTPEGQARIEAMVASADGFKLAEEDLRIRGQGTVFGARQAGIADLKLADILADAESLIAARREAFAIVARDPHLREHPAIAAEVRALLGEDVEWLFMS